MVLALSAEPIDTQRMTTMPERTATLTELVAAQIRSLLGYRDMRPSELARSLGENDQWVHVRLKGKVPLNLNDMHRIAMALNVPVGDLMPPPDVAARAVYRPIPRYLDVAESVAIQMTRPADNRPPGRPLAGAGAGVGRTGYLDRGSRRRRDR